MDEENKKEQEPAENTRDGVQPEEPEYIKQANTAAERLRAENDRKEALIRREEELAARRILGGETKSAPEKPVEETPAQYAERMLRGGK